MDNTKIKASIRILCGPEMVFDYTQNYDNRLTWDTFLKRADLIDGAINADKGVKAYCVAKNGYGMVTEYVTYDRPKKTAVKMTKGPYMFKSFAGSWTFKEINETETEVIFIYSYQLRFPFTLFSGYVYRNVQSNMAQRLVDLKREVEKNYY